MKAIFAPLILAVGAATAGAADSLVSPDVLVADARLSQPAREALTLAPRRYDTFWNSGDERVAKAALSPNFIDHTLPKGRAQGPEGPLKASRAFRAAVPDLSCEVEQMIVAGDRVTALLHFRGHFSGTFKGHAGQGQEVDFVAIDIYRVAHNVITEDWHLEDSLTLLRQLGLVAPLTFTQPLQPSLPNTMCIRCAELLQNCSERPQGIDPPAKVACQVSEGVDALFRFPGMLSWRFGIRSAVRPDAP